LKAIWKSREEYNDHIWAECSNCGFKEENYKVVKTGRDSDDYIAVKYHYCPNCGAEMGVKESGSENKMFKGKRKDNGHWVEGYLLEDSCGSFILPSDAVIERNTKNNSYGDECILVKAYEIDPKTICRNMEIVDKTANQIWENDIIKFTSQYKGCVIEYIRLVKYYNGKITLIDICGNEHTCFCDLSACSDELYFEKLGNFYDNPDISIFFKKG